MFQALKKRVQNEKGLTLIELLAVVVILGIIAAIAIPSIGGLIDNSKKDAHVANATQMINSAKTYVAGNSNSIPDKGEKLFLKDLIEGGYLDEMEDPDGVGYDAAKSFVDITKNENSYVYKVFLDGGERDVATEGKPLEQSALNRDEVKEPATATEPAPVE